MNFGSKSGIIRIVAEQQTRAPNRARRFATIILWIVAACFALSILAVFFAHNYGFILFLGPGCKEQIVSEVPSPHKKLKAVLCVRDCGATTRASTRVSVVRSAASGPGGASAEVLAGYEYPWDAKTHKIGVEWIGNDGLNVYYTKDVELTHLNNQVGNVHVHFELRP